MLKLRLIPVLFLKGGWLVRSERFHLHQNLGNPVAQVERYNAWDVDELIYIDITRDERYDTQRDDLGGAGSGNPATILEIIAMVARKCFMPLACGGKIRTFEDIRARLAGGADKITINTQALADPGFISGAAAEFGSQAVIVAIDFRRVASGRWVVFRDGGRAPTGIDLVDWAREAEARGAGELLLNDIDRDGTAEGYDIEAVRQVVQATGIPVIACGGAGRYEDFASLFADTGAAAAAAGNIFHFKELSYILAKQKLRKAGLNVR